MGPLCQFCREHALNPDTLRWAYAYSGVIRDAILQFKYHGLWAAEEDLARLVAPLLETASAGVDILVPMPLHPQRLRERGYNQAEALARSGALPIELASGALRRVHMTGPQARMHDAIERATNLADAFVADPQAVAGKGVLLLDDVCTTGATLNARSIALRSAGARAVHAVTLAREL